MILEDKNTNELVAPAGPISTRYYTQAPGTAYILPADETERERLSIQHKVYLRVLDNRLIVAPVKLSAGDRILESGVGGGNWILDTAKAIPNGATIYGIDIESRLFPKDIPRNVTLSINSVTALPKEWSNMFTYVRQRLLVAALRKSEWPTALGEIYRVLKPGGWVELQEAEANHEGPEEYMNLTAHYLKHQVYASRGLDIHVNDRLPSLLKEAGFVDVVSEKKKYPAGKWGGPEAEIAARANREFYMGWKKAVLEAGGFGRVGTEEEFNGVVDELAEWWEKGSGIYFAFHVHIARKPE